MYYDRNILNAVLRNELHAFTRKAFATILPGDRFLSNWHVEAITHRLQQVAEGRIKRLLITLPPRSLKSLCASVALPAWYLGQDPTRRIICASYSDGLSTKLANQRRTVMKAAWYGRVFPGTRISTSKDTQTEFETTRGGGCFATSVGGTLTGRGGNLIIIDDPAKPGEATSETISQGIRDWFDGTLYSRLDNKAEDAIILIMQRLHVDDLAAHVLEHGDWVHLNLPAIAVEDEWIEIGPERFHRRRIDDVLHPDRDPRHELDALKARLGSYLFNAQYQQQPVPPGGNMIRWHWFPRYGHGLERGPDDYIAQSWDTASSASEMADYSVCTTWLVRGDTYYLLDVFRERLEYPDLKRKVIELYHRYRPESLFIEEKGLGIGLVQELTYTHSIYPIGLIPQDDKVVRASRRSGMIEAGRVFLPEDAPWLGDFQQEVLAFPHGRHDDQVDSMVQFLGAIHDGDMFCPSIREL